MGNYSKKAPKQKKTRQEIDEEGRLLQRKRKHKGLPSGTRHSDPNAGKKSTVDKKVQDPRLGSKKPIPLIAEGQTSIVKVSKPKAEKIRLTPAQELAALEDDPKLEQLLNRVEKNHTLTDEEQHYLDRRLDRIEELMTILGYEYDEKEDDELDEDGKEDIVRLLKNS